MRLSVSCSPGPLSKSFIARICAVAVAPKQSNKEAEMIKERPHETSTA